MAKQTQQSTITYSPLATVAELPPDTDTERWEQGYVATSGRMAMRWEVVAVCVNERGECRGYSAAALARYWERVGK